MRKPDYIPTLTPNDFIIARKYSPCCSVIYCFMRDLMQRAFLPGTPEQEEAFAFFLMEVYHVGRIQGIREERHNRRAKKPSTENPDREAIVRLLDKADPEALHLIWIAARNLTRKGVKPND